MEVKTNFTTHVHYDIKNSGCAVSYVTLHNSPKYFYDSLQTVVTRTRAFIISTQYLSPPLLLPRTLCCFNCRLWELGVTFCMGYVLKNLLICKHVHAILLWNEFCFYVFSGKCNYVLNCNIYLYICKMLPTQYFCTSFDALDSTFLDLSL